MNLEGRFELPALLRLSPEDQDFVLAFVLSSGSLKEMGAQLGLSYPTVRNRLNDLIQRLSAESDNREQKRRDILDALASGELTVKEANRKLKELEL
jgi:hypothetical protein